MRTKVAAYSVVYVRGEVVQQFRMNYEDMDSEIKAIRFLFNGAVHCPTLGAYYKAPAYKCFDEEICFSMNGNMRLPQAAYYAVELTEILCLRKDTVLEVLDRFPQYMKGYIRRHVEMRWFTFTKFIRRWMMEKNAASILFVKRAQQRTRISILREGERSTELRRASVQPEDVGSRRQSVLHVSG